MPSNAAEADDWKEIPLDHGADDWKEIPLEGQDNYSEAADMLRSAGQTAMQGVNAASRFVDKYTGAPVRAAVGAYQNDKPVGAAFINQFARPPESAPTGKDIAAKAGMSEEEYSVPLVVDPFTNRKLKVSPAGVAGAAAETVMDPTMYIPGEAIARGIGKGAELTERAAKTVGEGLGHFAEERMVKAATGDNRSAIKKMARVKGQNATDVDKAIANLRKTGRTLLEADDAGPAAGGWFSTAEDIAREAEAKRRFYGRQIGDVGTTVDKLAPGAISPQAIGRDVGEFQKEIPNVGKGSPVRKRVGEEADKLHNYGLSEEEMGPAKPLNFADAQELKGQYPFERESPDMLISNRDATNKINRIISDHMDQAVERAKAGSATAEDLDALSKYDTAKQKYGAYKNVAEAGSEQAMRTLSRRMVSPSTHAMGFGSGIMASAKGGYKEGGMIGLGAAVANQVALARGSAFASRASDAISKKIMAAPGVYQKWLPTMQNAARLGSPAVVATHHQLLESDPEYRRLMQDEEP